MARNRSTSGRIVPHQLFIACPYLPQHFSVASDVVLYMRVAVESSSNPSHRDDAPIIFLNFMSRRQLRELKLRVRCPGQRCIHSSSDLPLGSHIPHNAFIPRHPSHNPTPRTLGPRLVSQFTDPSVPHCTRESASSPSHRLCRDHRLRSSTYP